MEVLTTIRQKDLEVEQNLQSTKINEKKQRILLNQKWDNLEAKEKILRREFQNFEKVSV